MNRTSPYQNLYSALRTIYPDGEARSIARLVFSEMFDMSLADLIMNSDAGLSVSDRDRLCAVQERLMACEPVQYVLGEAEFCGLRFEVDAATLIPRPETEQMVELALRGDVAPQRVLDVGSGSGCIAIAIKKRLSHVSVQAIDISNEALMVARRNAERNGVVVDFLQKDALTLKPQGEQYDLIVSNPPYICQKEAAEMSPNVLRYEPHSALFVPNDDPLRFYRSIARYASEVLSGDGRLIFEINPIYHGELMTMLKELNFSRINLYNDFNDKPRFVESYR